MNDFHRDDAWQKDVRDRVLAPGFYGRYASDGRYVFMDKGRLASILQKRYAVDTIVQGKDGAAVCIEEKIVRWPETNRAYTAFALETHSCTVPGHESPGWMKYAQADYLLYCFAQPSGDLDTYLIEFDALKAWFWPREEGFATFKMKDTLNRSMGRVVPISAVCAHVQTWRRLVRCQRSEAAA